MTAYTVDFVDVDEFVHANKIPEKVIKRGASNVWYVCRVPVAADTQRTVVDTWAMIRSGELVRVPLVPYVCDADFSMVIAAAVERGIYISQLVMAEQPPVRVHIIIGRPLERVNDVSYRFWLGFAIMMQ